jgi:hypothetical protein
MMKASTPILCTAILVLTAAAGCEDEGPAAVDTAVLLDVSQDLAHDGAAPDGPAPDAPADVAPADAPPPDTGGGADLLLGDGGTADLDHVFDSITLPTAGTASKIGVDFDKDGKIDNALGALLAALSSIVSFQPNIDLMIAKGDLLQLLRVQTTSLVTDPKAAAVGWSAKKKVCCTSAVPKTCVQQAKFTCFNGSRTFTPKPGTKSVLPGSITAGALSFGPGKLQLEFPLLGTTKLSLELTNAHVQGKLSKSGISDGIVAGLLTKSEVDNKVIPAVVKLMNDLLQDATIDATTKLAIKLLFDSNNDGTISTKEVSGNPLVGVILGGDVDVDKDGVKELSMGIAYTAVTAVITP